MIDKNEIDITNWIPQKDFNEMWEVINWVTDSHAKSDDYLDTWIFPKSYFRKYRTELAKLIRLVDRIFFESNKISIILLYKKFNFSEE